MGKEPEVLVEWKQPGPSAQPASLMVTRQLINEKPAFIEIRVQSPSKDGLSQGSVAAILIPLRDWDDVQLKLMA